MTKARDLASGSGIEAGEVVPHIIPGVLYPAVAGKDLSNTALGGSYTYGTAHTDGRSYYYTDIKGSKPIKDPRIGGHFGSQRHKAKSVQLLEQETATHGENVYSVDGREWFRVVSSDIASWNMDVGNFIGSSNHTFTTFFEIVGYFNDFNCISRTKNDRADDINVTVNGGTTRNSANTDKLAGRSTADTPLGGRYVDVGSVINHGDSDVTTDLGTTPRINTIKIEAINTGSEYWQFFGIELITQDTSSDANRSKIQIPSQNVVSYGKKFTVSGTPHYDPFNGFTSGNLAAVQALIDTDTSLGMSNWLSSSTYYRPFNGGRVVKWVDSSGNIKTSVTMMPPNAQNIAGSASNAHTLGNANDQTINFDTTTIANATPLSEVAKTFHWREFGNGAANGGTGAGSNADASMLSGEDDIAYVMDDGLTSHTADNVLQSGQACTPSGNNKHNTYIFIGTGVTIESGTNGPGIYTIAQNLPYGTHVIKSARGTGADPTYTIDGVSLGTYDNDTYGEVLQVTFHQPKKPPIPEDCVVLADYMLMADYVQNTSASTTAISKGVRRSGGTRDHFYDCGGAMDAFSGSVVATPFMFAGPGSHASNAMPVTLPYFGTSFTDYANNKDNSHSFTLDGSSVTPTGVDTDIVSGDMFYHAVSTLGLHVKVHTVPAGGDRFAGTDIATPIHTSSHYQTFETPFLHELVGGDRNMEQTNLIVTPDGKSWDEVTRDTSYIGDGVILVRHDAGWQSENHWNRQRGKFGHLDCYVKDSWCSGYDRFICLKPGMYTIEMHLLLKDSSGVIISINGSGNHAVQLHPPNETGRHEMVGTSFDYYFHRGDFIQNHGQRYGSTYTNFVIRKSRKNS